MAAAFNVAADQASLTINSPQPFEQRFYRSVSSPSGVNQIAGRSPRRIESAAASSAGNRPPSSAFKVQTSTSYKAYQELLRNYSSANNKN